MKMRKPPELNNAVRRLQYGKKKAYERLDKELKRLDEKFRDELDKMDFS